MYRAVTWLALDRDIEVSDEAAVTALAEEAQIDIAPASRPMDALVMSSLKAGILPGKHVCRKVEANVSTVSAYRGVREALSQQQRRIGQARQVVMVGRDIGTVVLPEADLKIYLDATAEERAQRRYEEIIARGGTAEYKAIFWPR